MCTCLAVCVYVWGWVYRGCMFTGHVFCQLATLIIAVSPRCVAWRSAFISWARRLRLQMYWMPTLLRTLFQWAWLWIFTTWYRSTAACVGRMLLTSCYLVTTVSLELLQVFLQLGQHQATPTKSCDSTIPNLLLPEQWWKHTTGHSCWILPEDLNLLANIITTQPLVSIHYQVTFDLISHWGCPVQTLWQNLSRHPALQILNIHKVCKQYRYPCVHLTFDLINMRKASGNCGRELPHRPHSYWWAGPHQLTQDSTSMAS